MIFRVWRLVVVAVVALATLASCPFAKTPEPSPASPKAPIDYPALEAAIENKIVTGSVALDNVRALRNASRLGPLGPSSTNGPRLSTDARA